MLEKNDNLKLLSKRVRLSAEDLNAICIAFEKVFDKGDELWIFGSRAQLDQRGGDIDIFIRAFSTDIKDVVNKKLMFLNELFVLLEEQRVDVIIQTNESRHLPIYDIAQETGIRVL